MVKNVTGRISEYLSQRYLKLAFAAALVGTLGGYVARGSDAEETKKGIVDRLGSLAVAVRENSKDSYDHVRLTRMAEHISIAKGLVNEDYSAINEYSRFETDLEKKLLACQASIGLGR